MRSLILAASAGVLAFPQSAAAKPQTTDLPKVGKWEINYDNDSCHLYAKFGTGDQEIILNLTRYQPGADLELRIYGKSLKALDQHYSVTTDFNPEGNPAKPTAWSDRTGNCQWCIMDLRALTTGHPVRTTQSARSSRPKWKRQ
ncbi:MAG: hypothetical protein JSR96_15620 [Proteobacteria bacterium]|nr:hypothetical protein [Pseudomonadota bacterium]